MRNRSRPPFRKLESVCGPTGKSSHHMITAFLFACGIFALLGVGAHSTGLGHAFWVLAIPIAKIMAICIAVGWLLHSCATNTAP